MRTNYCQICLSRGQGLRVWLERGKIKQSTTYPGRTEDYARAIQEERKKLIKAMIKARDEHGLKNVKVKGRFLYIDNSQGQVRL